MPQPLDELRRGTWHAKVGMFHTPNPAAPRQLHESDLHSSIEILEDFPECLRLYTSVAYDWVKSAP
jgi:hypothetical protein